MARSSEHYRKEYQARIQYWTAQGFSKGQAVGHPRKGELSIKQIRGMESYIDQINFSQPARDAVIADLQAPIWIDEGHAWMYLRYLAYRRKFSPAESIKGMVNRKIDTKAEKIPAKIKKELRNPELITLTKWRTMTEGYLSTPVFDKRKYMLMGYYH